MSDENYGTVDFGFTPKSPKYDFSNAVADSSQPVKPVLVLSNGIRVPVELKFHERRGVYMIYRPVIEGDLVKLMPMVCAVDADHWPPEASLIFPSLPEIGVTHEWMARLLANSPVLKGISGKGKTIRKDG